MIDEKENGTKLKLKMLSKRPLSDEVEELEKTLLGKEPDTPEETDGDEE